MYRYSRDTVRAELRRFNADIKSADILVKRPRLIEEHAISRNLKLSRERAADSVNDILEQRGQSDRMAYDPEFRDKMRRLSALMNSCTKI